MLTSLDQEATGESTGEIVIGGIVGSLVQVVGRSGCPGGNTCQVSGEKVLAGKARAKSSWIEQLRTNYEKDFGEGPGCRALERQQFRGHDLALCEKPWRYFNNQGGDSTDGGELKLAINIVFAGPSAPCCC